MTKKIKLFLFLGVLFLGILGYWQNFNYISKSYDIISLDTKNQITKPELKIQNKNIQENKKYYKLHDVVSYLKKYKKLPPNYITKKQALALGWNNKKGNLWKVADKMVIGGDRFGNREGKLPEKNMKYFEADVNYNGGFRNAQRIVYSTNGMIFYTKDHYKTFKRVD